MTADQDPPSDLPKNPPEHRPEAFTGPHDSRLLAAERQRRQRRRNWAVLIVLASIVVLIYAITVVKIRLSHTL